MKKEIQDRKVLLKQRIQGLEQKIQTAFKDFCQQPYYLHAILVHDGPAEFGHYYSFVYERNENVWWRFNDHSVTIETEEVVLKESIGGQKDSSKAAYMLIYINQFVVSKSKKSDPIKAIPSQLQ